MFVKMGKIMKLLRAARIKVNTSKGRIERDQLVVLTDDEFYRITFINPDAFIVIDADYVEPKADLVVKKQRGKRVQQ